MNNITKLINGISRIYKDIKGEIHEKDFIPIEGNRLSKMPVKSTTKLYEINPFKIKSYNHKIPTIIDEEEKLYLLSAKSLIMALSPNLAPNVNFDYRLEFCKKYIPEAIYSPTNNDNIGGYFL